MNKAGIITVLRWFLNVITLFCNLDFNNLSQVSIPVLDVPLDYDLKKVKYLIKTKLYTILGKAVIEYGNWIVGKNIDGINISLELLEDTKRILIKYPTVNYSKVHHLCSILIEVINSTKKRSLLEMIRSKGIPDEDIYLNYLYDRASRGRAFLWPSAIEYINKCLPGPNKNAIISMPTGSGKGFIAELAISQAIFDGWVVYLAPTNALTHQIRKDLKNAFKSLKKYVAIRSFIGGGEYTTLESEKIEDIPNGTIVVMTPEKCSLALRLNPKVFQNCRLCIFDECHLLDDKSKRGIISEIALTYLMELSQKCRFILMSAMIDNDSTEELAEWLKDVTSHDTEPLVLKWKPTRILRGVVGTDESKLSQEYANAREELEKLPERRKKINFEANYTLLFSLQGIWDSQDELDYYKVTLPTKGEYSLHKTKGLEHESVNMVCKNLATYFVKEHMSTLVFLPSNKHYPFSIGVKMDTGDYNYDIAKDSFINSCLVIAEEELGVRTQLRDLLNKGVAVHSACMIDAEKLASEKSILDGKAIVMFATPTLSQGLNLPASTVIFGGTVIGDRREKDKNKESTMAQLLNSLGRAGRAGYNNQGIAIVVPDKPIIIETNKDYKECIRRVSILENEDSSLNVSSPLDRFFDQIIWEQFSLEAASEEEILITSLVMNEYEEISNENILRKSYAFYSRKQRGKLDNINAIFLRLNNIKEDFFNNEQIPIWLSLASQRAGIDFFNILAIYQVMEELDSFEQIKKSDQIDEYVEIIFEILKNITPENFIRLFGDMSSSIPLISDLKELCSQYTNLERLRKQTDWLQLWEKVHTIIKKWLGGATYKEISQELLSIDNNDFNYVRIDGAKPIPKAIMFINEFIDKLAFFIGAIISVIEQKFEEMGLSLNKDLSSLALIIKYGCNSLETLYWYRYGIRFRIAAHYFSRKFPINIEITSEKAIQSFISNSLNYWEMDLLTNENYDNFEKAMLIFRHYENIEN